MPDLQDAGNGWNRTIECACVGRGTSLEQKFCTVLVWGIMLMILTLEEINKDRENPKMEYKQRQMNKIVFQQKSSEEPNNLGGNQTAQAAKNSELRTQDFDCVLQAKDKTNFK